MGNCLRCFGIDDEKEESLLGEDRQRTRARQSRQSGSGSETSDKARTGYRSFVVVKHVRHGFMLLEASKAKKGRHFQLPGGHVDASETQAHGEKEACRVAAARELLEETGLDMRSSMHRLVPVDMEAMGEKGQKLHQSRRRYFRLDINDSDSVQDIPAIGPAQRGHRLATPLSMEDFRLCLSHEHTGFKFERNGRKAAEALAKHSGGFNSIALMLVEGISED